MREVPRPQRRGRQGPDADRHERNAHLVRQADAGNGHGHPGAWPDGRLLAVRHGDVGLHQSGNAARPRRVAEAGRGLRDCGVPALQKRRHQERRRSARSEDTARAQDAEHERIHRACRRVEARDAEARQLSITPPTGGVLPGVGITAVLEATGNTFVAVTDERGFYRMPVRVGIYRLIAELQGFATVERPALQILTGQTDAINLQMSTSTLHETVTVTGEAPLLKTATSSLGGNIDPLQVQEMPSEGRNWMALLLLAPGSRSTSANPAEPLETRNANRTREYQTNVDGMQFANTMGGGGQPAFSQEMIAEFQYISNRFDATQGRSSGVQVNMITKSGTNRFAGSFRGNFRDDRFNAMNPVLKRVVPIRNQQFASSFGGPIVRDKLHFFAFDEYERAPKTEVWNTPFPRFNVALEGTSTVKHEGLRFDYQFSPQTRLMVKGNKTNTNDPFGAGNNQHPAA